MNETDVHFPDQPVEVPGDGHGIGNRGRDHGSSRPAPPPPPPPPPSFFPPASTLFGLFLGGGVSALGFGMEGQYGSFAELDTFGASLTFGDYASASTGFDVGVGSGGSVSAGGFVGRGSLSGFSGRSNAASVGASGPLGGATFGYSESPPDADGIVGYRGGSAGFTASTSPSASASISSGTTTILHADRISLRLDVHIMEWMARETGMKLPENFRFGYD